MKLICLLLMSLSFLFAEDNPDFAKRIVYEGIEDPAPATLPGYSMANALYENYKTRNPDSKITKDEFVQQLMPAYQTVLFPLVEQVIKGSEYSVAAISSLTDPAKLATLKGERAANPRLQKCVYWLALAEEQGEKPEAVLDEAAELNKTKGTP